MTKRQMTNREAYKAGQAAGDRALVEVFTTMRLRELEAAKRAILRAQKLAHKENDDQVKWILDRCLEELGSAVRCSTPIKR